MDSFFVGQTMRNSSTEDQELIEKFQKGDECAFNELVRKYQKQVYHVIFNLMNSHDETLDLSQDVFIRAYNGLQAFRGESNFFTWLYRIAVNLSLNALKKRKLRQMFSLESIGFSIRAKEPTPDQKAEKAEIVSLLESAIVKLPPKQKMVFTLRYYQQLSHAEIAEILGRDVGTIKSTYHLALRKLQKAVQS
jgi:RNA polymerase sigma factor (sigma-70 family)